MTQKNPPLLHFDFVIIGSGFGGSISAMRLAEKGYSVAIIEKGKRWHSKDFPTSNWYVRRFFWMPLLRCFGPQAMTLLKGVLVLHGVGVGGGSLVYANTLLRPKADIFKRAAWPQEINWSDELESCYAQAEKMLGATKNPFLGRSEKHLEQLAKDLNVEESFHATQVAVFFGEAGKEVADPYFDGKGPARSGCTLCGGCMVGCRYNAKNTLDKNYLYFAEKLGAKVFAERRVERIIPHFNGQRGYVLETKSSTQFWGQRQETFTADNVIFAAGALGTTELLLRNRDVYKTLPKLSPTLGQQVRTNGESLLGVTSFDRSADFSKGIAIGAGFNFDANTKIEPVRYARGSGVMSLLAVPLTGPGSLFMRPLKLLLNVVFGFRMFIRTRFGGDWAARSIILLVMQTIEEQMKLTIKRSPWNFFRRRLASELGPQRPPSYMPIAQETAQRMAEKINGAPQNSINEVLLGIPSTAHILGGVPMGTHDKNSVVNTDHQIHNYPGLFVSDGSIIPGNLGVNPSLTISALTERFCRQFQTKSCEVQKL
ncbi:MAG: GMC family oxidoreductase [Oligoflexales bacterium]|nr:GMC family oxidoreductase [Oligoflexales bacterium]